jgi:methanogenic corrinoid protein MtbC1
VVDGVNGMLCAPGDVSSLAKAIELLYEAGTLERLQQGVRPADIDQAWAEYIAACEGPCAGSGQVAAVR